MGRGVWFFSQKTAIFASPPATDVLHLAKNEKWHPAPDLILGLLMKDQTTN
jgi:hypothetical protein